jgi:hypothetical protein
MTRQAQSIEPEIKIYTGKFRDYKCTRFQVNRAAMNEMGVERGYKAMFYFDKELIIGVGMPEYKGTGCFTFGQNIRQKNVLVLNSLKLPMIFNIPNGTYSVGKAFFKPEYEELAFFILTLKQTSNEPIL